MYKRGKAVEEVPEENTAIWSCTQESCKGWMRDNFAFEHVPTCPLCQHPMESGMRVLPLLANSNTDMKSMKKGVQIQSPKNH
ncbi:cold-shock protein [Tumebacillus sp. ITR2]|uniref:Cold-shock protein n=1 Tax=Tumebacillus amylolyticus TaxID=2801339 RepID=A0ABS1JD75_9BACL|nr:cold-shock protein [Tumebacillus amylolyticus]MBL0388239.1 cold-shock protein [Tumebacillus amylolyticus]